MLFGDCAIVLHFRTTRYYGDCLRDWNVYSHTEGDLAFSVAFDESSAEAISAHVGT